VVGDGEEPEAGQRGVGGLDLVEADGAEVGEQGGEAVHRLVDGVCLVAALAWARGERVLDGAQDADGGGGIAASGMPMVAQRADGWRVFRRRRHLADGAGCPGCRGGRVPAR
jgi:hypothetical protein